MYGIIIKTSQGLCNDRMVSELSCHVARGDGDMPTMRGKIARGKKPKRRANQPVGDRVVQRLYDWHRLAGDRRRDCDNFALHVLFHRTLNGI